MTSCKSTGRCPDGPAVRSATGRRTRSRALGTASLGHLVLDARVFLRRRLADAAPVLVVPDLDQIVAAHDPRDAGNARILPLVGGQHDPPLGVELALACRAKHHSGQPALLRGRGRAQPQALLPSPFLGWIQLQAAFGALGDDRASRQLLPKTGGNGNPSLGIHGMPVRTQKHQKPAPSSSRSPLFPTFCHQHAERYHHDSCLSTNLSQILRACSRLEEKALHVVEPRQGESCAVQLAPPSTVLKIGRPFGSRPSNQPVVVVMNWRSVGPMAEGKLPAIDQCCPRSDVDRMVPAFALNAHPCTGSTKYGPYTCSGRRGPIRQVWPASPVLYSTLAEG